MLFLTTTIVHHQYVDCDLGVLQFLWRRVSTAIEVSRILKRRVQWLMVEKGSFQLTINTLVTIIRIFTTHML